MYRVCEEGLEWFYWPFYRNDFNTEHSTYCAPNHRDIEAHLSQGSLSCQVFPLLFSSGMWDSFPVICCFSYRAGGHSIWKLSSGGRGFSKLAWFSLNWNVNSQNDSYWFSRNLHEVCAVLGITFSSESIMQWVYATP